MDKVVSLAVIVVDVVVVVVGTTDDAVDVPVAVAGAEGADDSAVASLVEVEPDWADEVERSSPEEEPVNVDEGPGIVVVNVVEAVVMGAVVDVVVVVVIAVVVAVVVVATVGSPLVSVVDGSETMVESVDEDETAAVLSVPLLSSAVDVLVLVVAVVAAVVSVLAGDGVEAGPMEVVVVVVSALEVVGTVDALVVTSNTVLTKVVEVTRVSVET